MRLADRERNEIVELAKRMFGAVAVVRLFGSTTDDDRIGGDVDLHIQAGSAETATFRNELQFAAELKEKIGDLHVDVIVRPPGYRGRGIDQVALGRASCSRRPGRLRSEVRLRDERDRPHGAEYNHRGASPRSQS
jgi:uncharacterized protein